MLSKLLLLFYSPLSNSFTLESHQLKISVVAMLSRVLMCRIKSICILKQLDFPLA